MIKSALKKVVRRLVKSFPDLAIEAIREDYPDRIPLKYNRASQFGWGDVKLPTDVNGFEDLSWLFWSSPLNRGILRLDFDEAAALFKAVKSLQDARGVEIGRFRGGSTILLACAVSPGGRLTSIDIDPKDDATLLKVLQTLKLQDRVELKVADANDVDCSAEIDFAFIDGDHSVEAATKDHNRWGSRVRDGGLIIHHDMGCQRPLATQCATLKSLRDLIDTVQSSTLACEHAAGSLHIYRRQKGTWIPI